MISRKARKGMGLVIVGMGAVGVLTSWYSLSKSSPVVIWGVPADLGVLRKNQVASIPIRFYNITFKPVQVMSEASGCTASGDKYKFQRMGAFSGVILDYDLDPARLKVGPNDATIVLYVDAGDRRIKVLRPIKFVVSET